MRTSSAAIGSAAAPSWSCRPNARNETDCLRVHSDGCPANHTSSRSYRSSASATVVRIMQRAQLPTLARDAMASW